MTAGCTRRTPGPRFSTWLQDSGTSIDLAEGQEQVDNVLEIARPELGQLERIIYVEPRGVRAYDDLLLFWDDFLALGWHTPGCPLGPSIRSRATSGPPPWR